MRKLLSILILILSTIKISVKAQQTESKYKLTSSLGYGTENNQGNTAFYAGLEVNRSLTNRLRLEAGLTYFTTDIYNVYKAKPVNFKEEERRYNALFLNINGQYVFGNENNLINTKLKLGVALKYYDLKAFRNALIRYYPSDGREEVIPGTLEYYDESGVNVALYNGISFDAKVNDNLRLGVFLDVYSSIIPIEHFMPGIHATFKLNSKK